MFVEKEKISRRFWIDLHYRALHSNEKITYIIGALPLLLMVNIEDSQIFSLDKYLLSERFP